MSADQPPSPPPSETERQQLLTDLHELVDAIDRRGPNADAESESVIASDAADLREDAEARIAQLEDTSRDETP